MKINHTIWGWGAHIMVKSKVILTITASNIPGNENYQWDHINW